MLSKLTLTLLYLYWQLVSWVEACAPPTYFVKSKYFSNYLIPAASQNVMALSSYSITGFFKWRRQSLHRDVLLSVSDHLSTALFIHVCKSAVAGKLTLSYTYVDGPTQVSTAADYPGQLDEADWFFFAFDDNVLLSNSQLGFRMRLLGNSTMNTPHLFEIPFPSPAILTGVSKTAYVASAHNLTAAFQSQFSGHLYNVILHPSAVSIDLANLPALTALSYWTLASVANYDYIRITKESAIVTRIKYMMSERDPTRVAWRSGTPFNRYSQGVRDLMYTELADTRGPDFAVEVDNYVANTDFFDSGIIQYTVSGDLELKNTLNSPADNAMSNSVLYSTIGSSFIEQNLYALYEFAYHDQTETLIYSFGVYHQVDSMSTTAYTHRLIARLNGVDIPACNILNIEPDPAPPGARVSYYIHVSRLPFDPTNQLTIKFYVKYTGNPTVTSTTCSATLDLNHPNVDLWTFLQGYTQGFGNIRRRQPILDAQPLFVYFQKYAVIVSGLESPVAPAGCANPTNTALVSGKYTGDFISIICNGNYGTFNKLCLQLVPTPTNSPYCLHTGATCYRCSPGYFVNGASCSACIANCKHCTSGSNCLLCAFGKLWNGSNCANPAGGQILNPFLEREYPGTTIGSLPSNLTPVPSTSPAEYEHQQTFTVPTSPTELLVHISLDKPNGPSVQTQWKPVHVIVDNVLKMSMHYPPGHENNVPIDFYYYQIRLVPNSLITMKIRSHHPFHIIHIKYVFTTLPALVSPCLYSIQDGKCIE